MTFCAPIALYTTFIGTAMLYLVCALFALTRIKEWTLSFFNFVSQMFSAILAISHIYDAV